MIAALLLAAACITLGGAVAMTAWAVAWVIAALSMKSSWPQTRRYVTNVAWTSISAAGFALATAGLVISAMSHG